jgi:uncharacterized protein YhaN
MGASSLSATARPSQLLDAQAALQAAQDAAAEREAELRGQIARLRQEKRELEARAAGVDLRAMEVRRLNLSVALDCVSSTIQGANKPLTVGS